MKNIDLKKLFGTKTPTSGTSTKSPTQQGQPAFECDEDFDLGSFSITKGPFPEEKWPKTKENPLGLPKFNKDYKTLLEEQVKSLLGMPVKIHDNETNPDKVLFACTPSSIASDPYYGVKLHGVDLSSHTVPWSLGKGIPSKEDLAALSIAEKKQIAGELPPTEYLVEICMEGNLAPKHYQPGVRWEHPDVTRYYSPSQQVYGHTCIHCKKEWKITRDIVQQTEYYETLLRAEGILPLGKPTTPEEAALFTKFLSVEYKWVTTET